MKIVARRRKDVQKSSVEWQFFKFLLSLKRKKREEEEENKIAAIRARQVTLYQTSVRNESHSKKEKKMQKKNCQAFHLELIEQFFMCCNIIYGDVIK